MHAVAASLNGLNGLQRAMQDRVAPTSNRPDQPRPYRWYHAIGPGLITACVVIGPGSILTSSQVGAEYGYRMAWVVVLAAVCMMAYTTLGARLGLLSSGQSPAELLCRYAGRWLAVLIGLAVFFISATFQFGNNLGVHSAFRVYFDFDYTIVFFNLLAILFVFGFRNLYRALERLMMTFVGIMLICFVANLAFSRPSVTEMARGLVPSLTQGVNISLLGLVGTTFVATAAYFQAYLVQQKGWGEQDVRKGLIDARVAAAIMALITMMIMFTAGSVLRGQTLSDVGQVAQQLRPLFGQWGQALFCVGLFCAAYSSFLVNSLIGGFILSDGLGLGSKPNDLGPKLLTTVVLLTGMAVALYVIRTDVKPVTAIVAAQAVTVVASPLLAGVLLWLTNRSDVVGTRRNGVVLNTLAGCGLCLLLVMSWYTAAYKIWPAVQSWWG